MRKIKFNKLVVLAIISLTSSIGIKCFADNPIIQTKYTADPAPMVYNDTVFLYTSHDEDDATGFKMFNWMLYTSTDMVNWTDHGIIGGIKEPYKTFSWADGHSAWAPQCVARNGKFYFYCPTIYQGKMAIGVAVSTSPYGPFKDALGKPLISRSNPGDYDPTVFVDDYGQAYMYWGGNGPCYYAKLNQDMISTSGDIKIAMIDFTGTPPEASYTEGPWLWKMNSHYYLAWASRCCPEGIGYAMSDSPTGPWMCKGNIMNPDERSSGNHPGIIDLKGNSYAFGFNYAVNFSQTKTHRERRSICVDKMTYNPDGTIQKLPWWTETGAPQIGTLNPYRRTEAECIAWESGVKTEKSQLIGVYVTDIDNGDYIKLKGVNLEKGAKSFEASVASASQGGKIEIHTDSLSGQLLGTCIVESTGGWQKWVTKKCTISKTKGIHDLYFVFTGGEGKMFNFDWWKFSTKK